MNYTKEYPLVVQEIHKAFLTAGDKLLVDSKSIIEKTEKADIDKVKRLKSIGFIGSIDVKTKQNHLINFIKAENIAKSICEYARLYPQYKFISTNDVEIINNKYGLVCGGIEDFQGFVPENNLKQIEQFLFTGKFKNKRFKLVKMDLFQWIHFWPSSKLMFKRELKKLNSVIIAKDHQDADNYISNLCHAISTRGGKYGYHSDLIKNHGTEFKELSPFLICAPKNHMVKTIFKTGFVKFPDPIVLYPVEHGYLIVTAWGDEAKDPLVLNEKLN